MLLGSDRMISRTGKFYEEIHMILQHKDEILNQSPKRQLMKSQSALKLQMANKVSESGLRVCACVEFAGQGR